MRGCIKMVTCNVHQVGEFCAFLSSLLRQEIFLTRDVLNEFYCIIFCCFRPFSC
jgi:hypothetical protein